MKVTWAGWLLLFTLVVVFAVNKGVDGSTLANAKNTISSHNPFSNSLPEENEAMKDKVKTFWQDSLPDDLIGREKMVALASDASHFNQFEPNGRTIRREVGGRYKIGVMGIDQGLWSWAGIGSGQDISLPDGNLRGALWLYKKYKTLAWTRADRIRPTSLVISVPVDGWTEYVHTSRTPSWYPSGKIVIREKGRNTEYPDDESGRAILPPAEALSFRSASGQPEVMVLNN